jgi:hypothetical protein
MRREATWIDISPRTPTAPACTKDRPLAAGVDFHGPGEYRDPGPFKSLVGYDNRLCHGPGSTRFPAVGPGVRRQGVVVAGAIAAGLCAEPGLVEPAGSVALGFSRQPGSSGLDIGSYQRCFGRTISSAAAKARAGFNLYSERSLWPYQPPSSGRFSSRGPGRGRCFPVHGQHLVLWRQLVVFALHPPLSRSSPDCRR